MPRTTDFTSEELQSILEFTVSLARKAGVLILEGSDAIQSVDDVDVKKNIVDLVTEYDVRVEKLVEAEIKKSYPTFKFLGEETYFAGTRPPLTDEPTFCVDPIDGTTNFVHGFPMACISLGLIFKRWPVLGVIYNPFTDYLYTGVHGQGSYLIRGKSVRKLPLAAPKPLPSLSRALIGIEWGSDRGQPQMTKKSDSFFRLAGDPDAGVSGGKMAHGLRSLGSGALTVAMVAQGGLDVYWEIGPWIWDICAGVVIAQEAGCAITGSPAILQSDAPFQRTEELLTGKKFLFLRAIADSPEETGLDAQKRIMREFYETVEDYPAT